MSDATITKQHSRDEAEILTLLEGVRKAHYDKSGAAIAAAYSKDAIVCDLSPPLAHYGVNGAAKQAWLDTWEGPVELEPRDVTVTLSGDVAVVQGFTRMSGKPKAAPQPISFWLRDTICLSRERGAWKISHHHASVPFYMDGSLRPAFDLAP
jgi:ketosteroid isomerase-like protein